ncbi:hypothetical protein TFLX_03857 [Thermoflexales bacterium]|nr:hypothetical protein TFLX_03857 [Thermoflexales bacterium]
MRKFFTLVFGISFVMLMVVTTLALSLRSFVFDANFYVSTLKAEGVFQQLEKDPLGLVDLSDQIPQLAAVPADLQQRMAATLLPEGWLEKQAALAVQAWLSWFVEGQVGAPEIQIDLRQIRDRLQGPPGRQVAEEIVTAIPDCEPDQQPQLSLTQLPECIPQVFDRAYVAEQIAQTLSTAASQMPSQYDIGPRLSPSTRFGMRFNGRRVGVELVDASLLLLAVVTIGVWISGAVMGGRGRRWQRLGGLLLAGSLVVLASSLFLFVFGAALLSQAWLADLAAETSDLVRGVAQALVQQLAVRSLLAGGVLFVVALGLLAWGYSRPVQQYRS